MKRNLLFGFLLSLSVVTSAETDLLDIEARVDSLVRRYCDSIAMAASLDLDKVDSIAKAYYDSLSANPIFDPNKITVLENGNVGIDTVNPNYKLEVNGDIKGTKIIGLEAWSIQPQENWPTSFNLSNNTGFWHMSAPRIWDVNGNVVPNYMGIYWAAQQGADIAYKHVISFQESGNVGIGTESPTEKLDVMGKNQGTELWGYHRTKDFPSSVNLKNNNGFWHISGPRGYEGDNLAVFWVPEGSINNYGDYVRALTIKKDGNVGIGTVKTNGYKLAVEGTIGAREVVIEDVKWADFVFAENYNLRSLEEVDKFIKENKCLPEIPTEKEVAENGVSIGEMNSKLLQKVEELTLYMIELKKENNSLKAEMDELRKIISE